MEDNVNLWQNLQAFCFWSVGDGGGIDVWYNAWIESGLRIGDLDVTVPNVTIHAKVADLVTHDGSWNWILLHGSWNLIQCAEALKDEATLSVDKTEKCTRLGCHCLVSQK